MNIKYNSKVRREDILYNAHVLPVLLRTSRSQRSKSRHEEVESGEWNHVDRQLPEVSIQLTWEPEAGGNSGHGQRDQVVEISVGGCHQF